MFRFLGRLALGRLLEIYGVLRLLYSSFSGSLRLRAMRPATLNVLMRQIYFTGFEAVPVISWIALILGLVIVTQSLNILPRVGGEGLIGEVLVWVVIRELGPVFASVIVIARSGTAIASELGAMKLGKELTSLEMMGIDPLGYLIMPRIAGMAISVLVLTFYFETVSILGGYLLAGYGKNIAFSVYAGSVLEAMGFLEITVSLLKSLLFGVIIGAVCSYQGLTVERTITQIPQKTTRAVMGSLRMVFLVDAIITFIFFRSFD